MFVDKARIQVKGGDGGNGCCSFRREKYVPKGGPNGGDGGIGGDVVLRAVPGQQSLVDLVYNRHFVGGRGEHGKGKDQHGRRGKDVVLDVPIGTLVSNAETGELICDLADDGAEHILVHGGRGGRGNARFASSRNRIPRECEPGFPGEELEVELELKTIADVGLVGFPNAGKSTLLRAISDAHPKVAAYPFTTLHPVVGVVEFDDYTRFTVADIPGLIEGAADNIGLGHSFLRHIERTRLLVYVLDMAGVDGRLPWDDFHALQRELEHYMKGLSERPAFIAANKMDQPGADENLELLKLELPNWRIVPISAINRDHTEQLTEAMRNAAKHSGKPVPIADISS